MEETIKTGSPVRSLSTMKEWDWKQGDSGVLVATMAHSEQVTVYKLNINNSCHWVTRTDFEVINVEKRRQLTLEQALKEDKALFKVTPEQATKVASILSSDGFRYAAVIVCNSPYTGKPAYWQSEDDCEKRIKSDCEDYEKIELIGSQETLEETVKEKKMYKVGDKLSKEDIVFKTQQDIWAYLSASEEHKVVYNSVGGDIVYFQEGTLCYYPSNLNASHSFTTPEDWKPYIEPVKKEWWEQVPEGKPVLCWYGDTLFKDDRPIILGLITKAKRNQFRTGKDGSGVAWKYAIPATLEEVKQYLLENILDETSN